MQQQQKKQNAICLHCDLTDMPGCALMCPAAVNITRSSNYRNASTVVPKTDLSVGRVNKNFGVSLRSTQMEMLSYPALPVVHVFTTLFRIYAFLHVFTILLLGFNLFVLSHVFSTLLLFLDLLVMFFLLFCLFLFLSSFFFYESNKQLLYELDPKGF